MIELGQMCINIIVTLGYKSIMIGFADTALIMKIETTEIGVTRIGEKQKHQYTGKQTH